MEKEDHKTFRSGCILIFHHKTWKSTFENSIYNRICPLYRGHFYSKCCIFLTLKQKKHHDQTQEMNTILSYLPKSINGKCRQNKLDYQHLSLQEKNMKWYKKNSFNLRVIYVEAFGKVKK